MTIDPPKDSSGHDPGTSLDYATLFNATSNGMAFTERGSGRILDVNAAWIRSTGLSREHSIGKTALELGVWASQTEREACHLALEEKGRIVDFEATLRMRSTEVPHLISGESVEMGGNRCVLWEFRDISEQKRMHDDLIKGEEQVKSLLAASERSRRALLSILEDEKRAQEALRESEAFRRRLFDTSRVPIVVMDAETYQLIDCNSAAVQIYRYPSREEVLGKAPMNFSAPMQYDGTPSQEKARCYIEKALVEGAVVFEWRHQRPDGEIWDAEVHLMSFQVGQEQFLQFTLQEITQRRAAEAEILRMNEELERRVAERTAQLEAANRELEAFSYSVSHDLRAPLRGIDGFSQALMDDFPEQLPETGKLYLAHIRNGTQRMGQLIDDLLKLSRINRSELERMEVDLSGLCTKVLEDLTRANPERRVEISIQPGVSVLADRRLLLVALENLLGNAWKFTSKREVGRIDVGESTTPDGERVYFIRDNGAGFDMVYIHKLFNAFQRLHTTNEFEGTGIGLAIVKRIIHRHDGRIWPEAEPGKGATFFFTLPEADTRKIGNTS